MSLRHAACLCLFALVALAMPSGYAQQRGGASDEQIVQQARLVASGDRVDLYQHGTVADPGLVQAAERALTRMEELLVQRLDTSTLGPRVRIYVAASTTVSHVWGGYEHQRDPKAIVFLNPRVARLALQGTNATYAHELSHLLTWRFHSHTLREGLADHLALQLHPGAGVGPNIDGYADPPVVAPEIQESLGTTRSPPDALGSDVQFRRAYYFASYRFVHALIERAGMATFMQLYQASDPESEFPRLYGASRRELVAAAASDRPR